MRILVLGGTRFIGLYAVRALISAGHEIALFHRGQNKLPAPAEVLDIIGLRADIQQFVPHFRDFGPEVVLDMMGLSENDGTQLVSMFRGMAKRLVIISSADVYRAYDVLRGVESGEPDIVPLTEQSPLREKYYPYRDQCSGPEDRRHGSGLAES